jgi:hypothetical protein
MIQFEVLNNSIHDPSMLGGWSDIIIR